MGLNPKQKEAVEYLEGPLLVIAGPGTGKTQLLSEKVKYILENTDTNPENILCLTFTEAGALNMRERIKTITGDPKAASKVNIGTYHAFGSDILAQYKNYSDEYDRRLDAPIDEIIQYKLIREIQDALPGRDILHGDKIGDIVDTISSAKSAGLTAEDLSAIAAQNIEDSKAISNFANLCFRNIVPRKFQESLDGAYQPLYDELKSYADIPPILKNIDRSIKHLVTTLGDAISEATETGKITPLSKWKKDNFDLDENGNYRLADRIANKKLASLAVVMQKYNDHLKEEGLFDFDDMIKEAAEALKRNTGFRLTLSERYQYILLDEFQDTNPSQFEIIKQLTDYEKPIIMAVGDDDQAIYEFQGASATILSQFEEHYNAKTVTLVENYRSTQEILDFSREIINQVDDGTRFGDKLLHANKELEGSSKISRHEFLTSDTEYAFVADSIEKLIKAGVKQTDIAVIAPKHKFLLQLLPFLRARKSINIAYEKSDNLLENDAIHEILTISKFVQDIASEKPSKTSILEIMSFPFWGLSMLTVINTINRAKDNKKSALEYLAESEDEKIKEVANFIANLVAKSFEAPLEIFLDYLIGASELNGYRSPFLEYYTSRDEYKTFELYENLATLRSKLSKHFAGKNQIRLGRLVEMIEDYEEAGKPISSTSPYRDSENAVQVMSAHKAKGLEFEYVFIISADHNSWGKGNGGNNLLALPKNLIQIRHTGITDGERLRLLYVAATRAKKHLIITSALKDFTEKNLSRLEYLGEYVIKDDDGTEKVLCPSLPEKYVTCHYEESAEKNSENIKNWLTRYVISTPDMDAIYKERVKNLKLSPTMLTSFIDIVYAGPQEFFKQTVLRAPLEPSTESAEYGNLIHATFEEVTKHNISDEEAVEFFMAKLAEIDAEPEIIARIREKGPIAISTSLKAFGDIIRNGKAEVNFTPEKLAIEGVPIVGRIDHIAINEEEKTIEVYDYKTGGYHTEKWESQPTLYKYMLQLGFYKLLLNLSPTYSKYKVTRAHILFVNPDREDEVHDKIYEYSDESEKELITLIKAVYKHMTTLDFVKNPELFIAPDSQKGVKDIREFVKKVCEN